MDIARSTRSPAARWLATAAVAVAAREAAAQTPPEPSPSPPLPSLQVVPAPRPPRVQIHGFVAEGAFAATANDYLGAASSASLELFEAGINFSTEAADRLRVGMQLFSRDVGTLRDLSPRLDWAFLDYHWRSWLGVRAGIIKMPFGLYNEYVDIDAARLPILLPESMYPQRNRDVLLSHRGFAVYGNRSLGAGGELEYQAWLGTLSIPRNALDLVNATLDEVEPRYVAGGQAFWRTPVEGLRIGGTFLRASIDFYLTLAPASTDALIMAGLVPPGFDGRVIVAQRPDAFAVGSFEYMRDDWLFAGEYSRWFKRQRTSLPALIPTFEDDAEKFYAMATYRLSPALEAGGYYSVVHVDADDRQGRGPRFAERFHAFQRDLSATVRFDVNDHWLWKLEAHFMDGTASLPPAANPRPERYWGLFLLRTTVTF